MNSTLRKADDGDQFFFFPRDAAEGYPLELVDGVPPAFVVDGGLEEGKKVAQIPYLFGICPDQDSRNALYEWAERELFKLIEPAMLERKWAKCSDIIRMLSECDFYTKITSRKRTAR